MVYKKSALVQKDHRINRRFIIFLFCIQFILNVLFADIDWTKYGWQLYDNSGDGRSIAMGNTAVADDQVISALWNPSIDGTILSNNLTYGHQSRFAGIVQSDIFGYPFKTKGNRIFNLLILHESVSDIPNTQNLLLDWGNDGVPNTGDFGESNGYLDEGERLDNDNISYFNQHQVGVHLSTQFQRYGLNFGIGVRSIFHKLNDHFGSGISFDIGMHKSLWNNTNLGVSIHNILPAMIVWDNGETELSNPLINAGLAQTISLSKMSLRLLILSDIIIDVTNQSLSDDFHIGNTGGNWRFGTEICYNERINLRFGRNRYGYITTGLGLSWTNLELNYAYQLNSNDSELGNNHVISFMLNTTWLIDKIIN